jgi:acid phosphatase
MVARMTKRFFGLGLAAFGIGCAFVLAAEPANLDPHKDELRAYVKSGEYDRDIATVAVRARAWLEERAARRSAGERLVVVFDLDETLLSNLPFMLDEDFGGTDAAWDAWMGSGKDPAIEPVRELYRVARRLGVDVILLTGRHARIRAGTEKNLRDIGCAGYAELICRPDDSKGPVAAFKTAERQRLTAEGHVIIANIGDQESDRAGGYAERTFKLPDPFYLAQ